MKKENNMAYQNPTGDEFPILAWNSVPAAFTSKSRYKELHYAGFNLSLTQFPDIYEAKKALEAAENTGVKLIVCFPELKNDTINSVNLLKGYSSLAGWFLGDEDNDYENEDYEAYFSYLRELSDLIYGIDSSHLLYYNLYPMYHYPEDTGLRDYSTYVEKYVSIVNPEFVSFDYYPIVSFGDIERFLRSDFFLNLLIIMTLSRNKPFWAFYLAVKHKEYPTARIEDLRFETFSALAFGAQCIQCFSYWQPEDQPDGEDMIHFEDSPIDIDGNPTNTFYDVQIINNEIKAVSNVFLGMHLWRIGYIGTECPKGLNVFKDFPDWISIYNVTGKGFLISNFSNGGKEYLLIINCDILNSQDISVKIDSNVKQIGRDGFIINYSSKSVLNFNETVEAGDHLLFQFEN